MTRPVLVAEGLCFRYGRGMLALSDLSLRIQAGERLALVGGNGAGKSTLLLHLNGTLRPEAGTLHLNGAPGRYDRAGLVAWRQQVGVVFQDPDDQLFAASVAEDVSFGPLNLGLGDTEVRDRVAEALAALGISALAHHPTHQLSLGQKKRVALAGVLAMRPSVLVLDEPTAGLDAPGARQLLEALARLHAMGTTLVIATHDTDLVLEWADRVAVLEHGRLRAAGPPAEVLDDPALLERSALRRPWVLEVAGALAAAGLRPAHRPAPRSLADLRADLAAAAAPVSA